ncbi:class I SAM-dependent methyltransferase [Nocardia speluncae]|uniref:Class I SAM-dependent methyltransferase n=1 Tax=Nocardia speluncae TaxID=419477 RepID=A0A846XEJ9_9NOCA|nr:class I SAM-dependent methyltransferase [Nocardia speluncae]NKY33160.1 class I SAM-dependent methyltransferase [Nocardia speluncae]
MPEQPMPEHTNADTYSVTAEFYDLMATPYWAQVDPLLPDLLAEVDTLAGPVVDIGAGTGLSTMAVADALPDAEIIAVEPSGAMRAVLMSRLAARKDLRERITVLPSGFLDAGLAGPCAAVVALGVLGHFDGLARARVWTAIADLLAPGALAVVEVQQPGQVVEVSERCYTRARAGALRYEGWSRALPVDDESLIWRMTYRAYRDTELLREHRTEHQVWPVPADRVVAEAAAAGLTARSAEVGPGLLCFGRPEVAHAY